MPNSQALSADRPFPGLRPFDHQDSAYFFGRQEQTYALYNLLDLSQFVAVIGSSGSGKSSLVRAGLLPLLDQDNDDAEARAGEAGAGIRKWEWVRFNPGDAPIGRLAEQLARKSGASSAVEQAARREALEAKLRRASTGLGDALSSMEALEDRRLLIVVDQFEELFRYGASGLAHAHLQEERDQFIQLLLTATSDRSRRIYVMMTMRSDFIGDCAQFAGLPEAVSECQFLVPSLTRLQREDVIVRPLAPDRAAAWIEPALVQQLLNDVGSELDQLPVLQHCLSRLWEVAGPSNSTPPHRRLTREHYAAVGGVAEALSHHADEVFASLAGHEAAVEKVFRALSEEDNEGRAIRRALGYAQLRDETGIDDDELRVVVDRFRADDCSFLMPSISALPRLGDDVTIDIGHEALLRRWHRISAEMLDPVDEEEGQPGWLEAEARSGRDYRMMRRLANDPDAILPERLITSWDKWQPTTTWADRYGGHIERVQSLVNRTRATQRRRRLYRGAAISVIAVLAIGVVAFAGIAGIAYKREVVLSRNTRQERAALLNEMTEIVQTVSTKLRFVPGTNDSISSMLKKVSAFSQKFSKLLNNHYQNNLEKQEKIIGYLLKYRADLLMADYDVNFGAPDYAIALLTKTENDLHEFLQINGREARSVQLLRADIQSHRANAEAVYGATNLAMNDFADAEKVYRDLSTGRNPVYNDDFQATAYYPEMAKQRLAELYQSRIFLDLQYRNDANAAAIDLMALEKLAAEGQKAHPDKNDDIGQYWKNLPLGRLRADLLLSQHHFDEAITDYNGLLKGPDTHPGQFRAFLEYKLALAQSARARDNDVVEAIGHLKSASTEFCGLTRTDPKNMWWRLVCSWVDYALAQAYLKQDDRNDANRLYNAALAIDTAFAKDLHNRRAQRDKLRDETALAGLGHSE